MTKSDPTPDPADEPTEALLERIDKALTVRVTHPTFPHVVHDVPAGEAEGWTAQGWKVAAPA